MTTADWALIISIGSAVVSFAGFVWNVWSKFIFPKPRVDVSFNFMTVVAKGKEHEHVLSLSATNMGPVAVTLHCTLTIGGKRWWRRKPNAYALLNPLHDYPMQKEHSIGPFGGGLPKKLDVGEQFTSYFISDHEGLASGKYDRIGFADTFGRHHWAPRAAVANARKRIREECDKKGKAY
jgi:hypothetical protein